MAECAVIEYFFDGECVCVCVCCGYSFCLDFWFSNERWLDGCLHFTDLCLWKQEGEKEKDIIIIIIVCVCCVFNELSVFFCPSICYGFLMFYCIFQLIVFV